MSVSKYLVNNALHLVFWGVFCCFTIFLSIRGGVHVYKKKGDLIFELNVCQHGGEFCPTCPEDNCVCKMGWGGEYCNQQNTGVYYPQTYWNRDSERLSYPNGEPVLTEVNCKAQCALESTCKASIWNSCWDTHDECTAESDVDCCIPRCMFLKNKLGMNVPYFKLGYEQLPQDGEQSQEKMYVKVGTDCIGYQCYYNEKYGLVHVHEIQESHADWVGSQIETFVFQDIYNQSWFDSNKKPESLPQNPKSILEVNEMPYLQSTRWFDHEKITVVSSSASRNKALVGTDLFNTSIKIIESDWSYHIAYPPQQKYDLIVVVGGMYGRRSLPKLMTNIYNHLEDGGVIYIRQKVYTHINSSVLHNNWVQAGLPKTKFIEGFLSLFDQLEKETFHEELEPSEQTMSPFLLKNNICWEWNDEDYYHPGHSGKWFYFVGKK